MFSMKNCVWTTPFFIGILLMKVGFIGALLSPHNKAFYYVMLSGVALCLMFLCSVGFVESCTSVGCFYICIVMLVFVGLAIGIIIPLSSQYKRDNKVNLSVSDATLAQFNLSSSSTHTSGTTLDYHLTVKVVVGPNRKKQGVSYDAIQAWASYQGINFTSLSLPPFSLGGKTNHTYNASTVVLHPLVFQGRQDQFVLPPDGLKQYHQDEVAGRFNIRVTLSYAGFRGHHRLKGVDNFALKELPLPNVTSGWSNQTASSPLETEVVCIIVLSLCIIWLFFCLLWWCSDDEKSSCAIIGGMVCTLLPLIQIATATPLLVRALKTSNPIKFSISTPTLTQFNFSSSTINNTLAYNLSLAITIGPNNKKIGAYFDKMEVATYYQGQNFTSLSLAPLYLQGRQTNGSRTIILHPVLQGRQVLVLVGDGLKHYQKETESRHYNILVRLSYSGIRTDDVHNSIGANGTSSSTVAGRLKGVASFDLRVPLLVGDNGADASASNKNRGFNLCMISGFLAYGLFTFPFMTFG